MSKPTEQERVAVWAGELIVQNGRQSGARRPLLVPLTIVGNATGCDIRLNSQGIDPRHCLLVHGPDGLTIRDLESANGTFVNGERIASACMKDGDLLTIGAFQFRLHLPPRSFSNSAEAAESSSKITVSDQDALRLQAAAVAAQQAALGEEEARLLGRKGALQRQEEQLASHLEGKRRKLLALQERAHAERQSLQKDRQAYEAHLDKITSDLTQAQRDVLDAQEKLWADRRRLAELHRRLRRRTRQQADAQRAALRRREEELERQTHDVEMEQQRLREHEQKLDDARLEFNGEYAMGRHQLQLGWQRLRHAQRAWRQRRTKEHLALRDRERTVLQSQIAANQDRRTLHDDQRAWTHRRLALGQEIHGLETRIRNQRQRIIRQQLELNRLDTLLRQRHQSPEASMALVPLTASAAAPPQPAGESKTSARLVSSRGKGKGRGNRHALVPVEVIAATVAPARVAYGGRDLAAQQTQLDCLAGDLADQRLMLLEQAQLLVQAQQHWENERQLVANDLEAQTQRLQEQEQALGQRERAYEQAEHQFRIRHRELTHLRQHLVAWRARLKMRENALEAERQLLLTEIHKREDAVHKQLAAVAELRRRWTRRRKQELARLHHDIAVHDRLYQDCTSLREDLGKRLTEVEEGKLKLTEKSLALEQYRQELFVRIDQTTAERRLELLRRRWHLENAAAIRHLAQERETLKAELTGLKARHADMVSRQQVVVEQEHELTDKQNSFEHQQALAGVRGSRLQQELQSAESQRLLVEEQLGRMKEEVERIARQLLEEPEAPPSLPVEKAA